MVRNKKTVLTEEFEEETVSVLEVQSSTTTKNSLTNTSATCVSVQATKLVARRIKLSQPVTNNKVNKGNQSMLGYTRSVVKHTSKWIPGSFGPSRDMFKNKSESSVTGACSELDLILEQGFSFIDPCPFRLRYQRSAKGTFVITLLNVEHICPRHKSRWSGPAHTSHWLGGSIGNNATFVNLLEY